MALPVVLLVVVEDAVAVGLEADVAVILVEPEGRDVVGGGRAGHDAVDRLQHDVDQLVEHRPRQHHQPGEHPDDRGVRLRQDPAQNPPDGPLRGPGTKGPDVQAADVQRGAEPCDDRRNHGRDAHLRALCCGGDAGGDCPARRPEQREQLRPDRRHRLANPAEQAGRGPGGPAEQVARGGRGDHPADGGGHADDLEPAAQQSQTRGGPAGRALDHADGEQ